MQQIEAARETLTVEEAADLIFLGRDAMKALVDNGVVPAVRCNQKHTVMLREDVLTYVRDEGRRQAEERRKSAKVRTPKAGAGAPAPSRPGRQRRTRLPNLRSYEVEG